METFVNINILGENEIIALLKSKILTIISELADKENADFVVFLKSQGIGKRLSKESQKVLTELYHLDTLSIDRKRVSILKKIHDTDSSLVNALSRLLVVKYGERLFYEYELLEDVLDKSVLDIMCLLSEYSKNQEITFDRKHYIFYKNNKFALDYIINSVLSEMPVLISVEDYESSSLFKKKLVAEKWSKSKKKNYYLRKDTTELNLAIELMDESFPNGYHIQNDYKKLCGLLKNKYGNHFSCPSNSVVTWKLQHFSMFCQIGRGTYLLWKRCPGLDLLEQAELISYIQSQEDVVYYSSILEHFKDEFREKGITNQYYVKGIVDHYIDGYGYETTRDFIKKEGASITGKQAILKKALSYESVFDIQQLRNDFPGVKDYTFQIVLLECEEIISLGDYKYVSIENSGVTDDGEDLMINVALETVKAKKGIPVIAKKVLTKIKLFTEDWRKDLGYITTPSALFSFLSKSERANELFEFRRPYFALKGANKDEMNFRTSLFKTLSSLDEVTLDIFRDTIVNFGVTKRHPMNFMDVFEEMSDEYLLVDRFKLLRISKLYITREEIDKIRTKVLAIVTKKKIFESKFITNFKSFPKEIGGLAMNGYLVLGVVATYLQNDFDYEIIMRGNKLTYQIKEA